MKKMQKKYSPYMPYGIDFRKFNAHPIARYQNRKRMGYLNLPGFNNNVSFVTQIINANVCTWKGQYKSK